MIFFTFKNSFKQFYSYLTPDLLAITMLTGAGTKKQNMILKHQVLQYTGLESQELRSPEASTS